jgi:hypothetical protein
MYGSEGTPAKPVARLNNETIDAGIVQTTARGNARRAAADDRNFGLAFHEWR